jgi:GABA(A) receptor-associated protein
MDTILSVFKENPVNTKEADRIMSKYPDRIPVILSRNKNSITTPELDRYKYLVPSDLTIGQFLYVIRKRLNMSPEKALFLFVDHTVVCNASMIASVYAEFRNPNDGFLHVVYSCENTFGY